MTWNDDYNLLRSEPM